ncbi:MAG TPA: hypothetical protein VNN73_19380 [Blastocatellia bacterium]|nr:hypothetical protein [Blastocatellia bacterium]
MKSNPLRWGIITLTSGVVIAGVFGIAGKVVGNMNVVSAATLKRLSGVGGVLILIGAVIMICAGVAASPLVRLRARKRTASR